MTSIGNMLRDARRGNVKLGTELMGQARLAPEDPMSEVLKRMSAIATEHASVWTSLIDMLEQAGAISAESAA